MNRSPAPLHTRGQGQLRLVVALLAALLGAQWLVLHHGHAADGLAPECEVCAQAPAFAHAATAPPPVVAARATPMLIAPTPYAPSGRPAPAPRARGPPAPALSTLHS
jgi:hypothetical protein